MAEIWVFTWTYGFLKEFSKDRWSDWILLSIFEFLNYHSFIGHLCELASPLFRLFSMLPSADEGNTNETFHCLNYPTHYIRSPYMKIYV